MDTTEKPARATVPTADPPVVLVVDDDRAICDYMTHVFGDLGVSCRCAGSTDDVSDIELKDLSLVILDLSLGGEDAVDVLESLANEDYDGSVVLITGFDVEALEPVQKLGAMLGLTMAPCLTKPVRPAQLRQALEAAVAAR